MKEIVLAKIGEIVLKGLNRRQFEDQLLKNIRKTLKSLGSFEIKAAQSLLQSRRLRRKNARLGA